MKTRSYNFNLYIYFSEKNIDFIAILSNIMVQLVTKFFLYSLNFEYYNKDVRLGVLIFVLTYCIN